MPARRRPALHLVCSVAVVVASTLTLATGTSLAAGAAHAATDYSALKINEIQANGAPDFVEVTNTGSADLDISGVKLLDDTDTDGVAKPHQFQAFPAGTVVTPGGFATIDSTVNGLGNSGDAVRLYTPDTTSSVGATPIDSYTWSSAAGDGKTFGRCPDGIGPILVDGSETKGAANDCPPPDYSGIKINEVFANGDGLSTFDFIELTNTSAAPVYIGGMKVLDNGNAHTFDVVPSGTTVAPGGFYAIYTDTPKQSPGFGLGEGGDSARLYAPSAADGTATPLDTFTWTTAAGTSWGACPDGSSTFVKTTSVTYAAANDCGTGTGGGGGGTADYSGIKINEVESSDPDGGPDWVELTNTSAATADISGLKLLDNDDTHAFQSVPAGTVLDAGGFYAINTSFGLGAPDSVRLYAPSATAPSDPTLDTYTWQSHATTTYGRCPDGTGAFTTTVSATRGAANDCPGPIQTSPWPGGSAVSTADTAGFFGENLSGLVYQSSGSGSTPGTIWAVKNGPSTLYKLVQDGDDYVAAGGDWAGGKHLTYTTGAGDPDAEGVTFTDAGPDAGIYVSTERDNTNNGVSRPAVLEFMPNAAGTSLTAVHDWNLTPDLPGLGANLGLEGVTWVPDSYLTGQGMLDQNTGAAYDPADYPLHGNGLFLVGVEATGKVYAYALNSDGSFKQVAHFDSGFPAVMDLHWDAERQDLWVVCDDTCGGDIGTFTVHGNGQWTNDVYYARPAGMPNYNNEGFTIASQNECVDGVEPAFWSDDTDDDMHALRQGTVDCTALPPTLLATTTTPVFGPNGVTVTVAPATGTGTPTGTVTLTVTGGATRTASLAGGVATFANVAPADQHQVDVSATYGGDDAYSGSMGTASRTAPTLTGSADAAPNAAGWVDTRVTVTWACTRGTGALTTPCPAPEALGQGTGLSATATITAADGATASATVGPYNVDTTAPSVRIGGVADKATYHGAAPTPRCVATDALSGVDSCQLFTSVSGRTVTASALATDVAGNVSKTVVHYHLAQNRVSGAPYSGGRYHVKRGHQYTIVVLLAPSARPHLLGPVKAGRTYHGSGRLMNRRGTAHGLVTWTRSIRLPHAARPGSLYKVGVRAGDHTSTIRLQVKR